MPDAILVEGLSEWDLAQLEDEFKARMGLDCFAVRGASSSSGVPSGQV
jgi:hypothetical protein